MNMIFNRNMKKLILSLIPFACALASCNTVSIEQPVQYGELSVSLTDEPVIEVQTKAETPLDKTSEDAKSYYVSVYNSEHVLQGQRVSYFDFTTQTLQLGTYYVTAENCTAAEAESGNGKMRLYGESADVTLSLENLVQTASVKCEVVNAKVSVEFDSSVTGLFTDLKVVLKGGTTEDRQKTGVTVNETAAGVVTETWFNPSTLSYTISGVFTQISKEINVSDTIELEAKDNIKLLVKVNAENGQLSIATITVDNSIKQEILEDGEFNPYE